MKNPTARRIRLADYFIEQRLGVNREAAIELYARIYSRELKAFYTPPPTAPVDLDWKMRLLRHGLNDPPPAPVPAEIPALDRPKIKTEIGKAARGMDADMALLDSLVLEIPIAIPTSKEPEACEVVGDDAEAVATVSAAQELSPTQQSRVRIILEAIKGLGLTPDRLERPKANGGGGDRARIREAIPQKTMPPVVFKNTWNIAKKNKIVSYKGDLVSGKK